MSPLVYIIRKSLKNSLLEILKSPGKLVMYIFIIAMIVGVIFVSFFTKTHIDSIAPMFFFTGILFLYITMFVVIGVVKGLSGGNAIFEMNDVNLLFVSPVNPRKILLYGIIQMAKAAFAAGFFILFQASSLANFGIGFDGILIIFGGFLLSVVALMTTSLLIYSVTNGSPGRKNIVKILAALVFLPLVIYSAFQYFHSQDIIAALENTINSPFLRFVPVAGWTASGVTAILSGETGTGLLLIGLNIVLCGGIIAYIMLTNPDYYEDVLVATETAYEKKRAVAEGDINAASPRGKTVRITKTGISGRGAAAFFGKHVRESFRQSRFGFLNLPSVLIVVGAVIMCLIIRELSIAMQILMWVQIFLIGTGRGLKETYSHYIYMIPESSFKKIIWSNMEIMARTLIESILVFGISGLILQSHILYIIVCIMTYTLFSFLLLSVNYLSMRFTGADLSMGLLILIYYIAVVLVMAPGLALAIVTGIAVGGDSGYFTGLIVLTGWELAAGIGCFALSKGVLHDCDMAMLKTNK